MVYLLISYHTISYFYYFPSIFQENTALWTIATDFLGHSWRNSDRKESGSQGKRLNFGPKKGWKCCKGESLLLVYLIGFMIDRKHSSGLHMQVCLGSSTDKSQTELKGELNWISALISLSLVDKGGYVKSCFSSSLHVFLILSYCMLKSGVRIIPS